jgi:hypothetical protein
MGYFPYAQFGFYYRVDGEALYQMPMLLNGNLEVRPVENATAAVQFAVLIVAVDGRTRIAGPERLTLAR